VEGERGGVKGGEERSAREESVRMGECVGVEITKVWEERRSGVAENSGDRERSDWAEGDLREEMMGEGGRSVDRGSEGEGFGIDVIVLE
jgi:hypothetical protein